MTREVVQRNEEERFEKYLSIIYQAFPPSRLNHFEHNLDVWRQLWRVCEISDLLVLTVDARHPLFHFPPSLYEFIVKKQKKHMVVVFNKIDLVPSAVLVSWQRFFEKRYPGVVVLMFSSHPNEDTITCEDNNIFERKKAAAGLGGRQNTRKSAPIGVKQLIHTWRVLAQDTVARREADATHRPAQVAVQSAGDSAESETDQMQHELSEKVKQSLTGLQVQDDVGALVKAIAELGVSKDDEEEEDEDVEEDQEEDEEEEEEKESPASMFGLLDDNDDEDEEETTNSKPSAPVPTTATTATTKSTSTSEDTTRTTTASATVMVRAAAQAAASHEERRLANTSDAAAPATQAEHARDKHHLFTVGLVGHPNAGKSSLINSVLGKTVVSVSNTPGHTKHLQTISTVPGAEDVQLCDCPGLVFPAADMPRPLQVLMGIFPLTNLREPYSCVQFLAERLPLVEIYALQPYVAQDSDCAIHGPMAPGGVSAIADEETFGLQAQCGETEQEYSRFAYREGKYTIVSRPGHLAHFVFGTVSSALPVAEYLSSVSGNKGKQGAAGKRGKKSGKNGKDSCDDANDIFNFNDGREDMFADLDLMLAADGVDMGSYQGYSNSQKDGAAADSAKVSAALKPRFVWSAWRICEALAVKKGWREDAGRLDTYRAGMQIIRDVIEGRLSLYFVPPELE